MNKEDLAMFKQLGIITIGSFFILITFAYLVKFFYIETIPNAYRILKKHDRYLIERHYGVFIKRWVPINYREYNELKIAEDDLNDARDIDNRKYKAPEVVKVIYKE
jgi:hypothetical protein